MAGRRRDPFPVDVLALDWGGPAGDRHHGETMLSDARQRKGFDDGTAIRNHRQVSPIDTSEPAAIAVALGVPGLDPGLIADSICTEGIPGLTSLPRMTRMVFGSGAVIMLGGENHPCTIAGGLVQSVHGTRPRTPSPRPPWAFAGSPGGSSDRGRCPPATPSSWSCPDGPAGTRPALTGPGAGRFI